MGHHVGGREILAGDRRDPHAPVALRPADEQRVLAEWIWR